MLLAGSLLVALVLADVALRILGVGAPRHGSAEQAAEGETTAETSFDFFTYHPRLGWDLVPGAEDHHETPEIDVTIHISEQGLRADRLYELGQQGSMTGPGSIVALGDSFTFGHGVEVNEAWPARLEAELGIDVPNLAVTGYGTDQQLLRFEAMGADFRPRMVVLGLFVGNVFRNARDEQLGYPKPRFLLDDGELRLPEGPVPEQVEPESRLWRLGWLLSKRGRDLYEHLGHGQAWPITGAILDRLNASAAGLGAETRVVILPKDQSIYGQGWRRNLHDRTLARLRALLDEHGLPFLDLTPILRSAASAHPSERLYYPLDGHWTAEGHRVASMAIADWLRSEADGSSPEADWPNPEAGEGGS